MEKLHNMSDDKKIKMKPENYQFYLKIVASTCWHFVYLALIS